MKSRLFQAVFFLGMMLFLAFAIQPSASEFNLTLVLLKPQLIIALSMFFLVWFFCFLINRSEHLHAKFSHDHDLSGVQKFHQQPVPRIGGLGIFLGLLLGCKAIPIWLEGSGNVFASVQEHFLGFQGLANLLLFCALPVFLGGLVEDITKRVSARVRFILSLVSAASAAVFFNALVLRLNIPFLDVYLAWPFVALVITIVGIAGVTQSFNLIDGYNGLSAGVSIILMAGIVFVAHALGDQVILMLSLVMGMATLGFLVWNWPEGRMFLGDGGAYFLGYVTAVILVLLIARNPSVSSWFALVVVGYPVFETWYSIYRRKILNQQRYDIADDKHLHQLIYKLIERVRGGGEGSWISNNSLTALPIWFAVCLATLCAVYYYNNTPALMVEFLVGIVAYKVLYRTLTRLDKTSSVC